MKKSLLYLLLIMATSLSGIAPVFAQVTPQGISYQTTVRNLSGTPLLNQSVSLRFSIYAGSPGGLLEWQEDHSVSTNDYGMANVVIGTGVSTGAGSAALFSAISWGTATHYLKISLDVSGGSSYTDMGQAQLFAVPYALHAEQSGTVSGLSLAMLADVDVSSNMPGNLLKWNGTLWVPAADQDHDTVLFAYNAFASSATDTALYTYGNVSSDTVLFAQWTDSAQYAGTSGNAVNAGNAVNSDTALYAFAAAPSAWLLNGNSLGTSASWLGNSDSSGLNLKTNNTSRMLIKSDGDVTLANPSTTGSLSMQGDNGVFCQGAFGSSFTGIAGAGTRMTWYPGEGSFRAGGINGSQWDTVNSGEYSAAFGYNTKSHDRSFCSGSESEALDYSMAIGRKCSALPSGGYPEGNSVALGDSCVALSYRDVVIGRNNYAAGAINILIGYRNFSSGNQSVVLGSFCTPAGNRSTIFGYHGNTTFLKGGFVYADASSSSPVTPALAFQFVVRASGGVVFYTDSLNTMGVTLFPGGGSWAAISDRNKKTNIATIEEEEILRSIVKLRIKSWNYISQANTVRHVGPMSQEFYRTFHVGESNVSISGIDMDGVILAGIKALDKRTQDLRDLENVGEIKKRLDVIDNTTELNRRLDKIEAALKNKTN